MNNVVTDVSNTLHFVSDDELLLRTSELARHETELTVVTIQHLDEIERRELYDKRGYPSLFEYAVRELHYNKGCAWRRIMVMKLCRAVPGIADKLRSGELNLTTASQLQNAIEKRVRKAARERASESVSVPAAGAVSAGAEELVSGEVQPARPGVAGVAVAASGTVWVGVGAAATQAAAGESAAGESAAAVPLPAGSAGAAPAAAVSSEPTRKSPDQTAAAARESAALPPVADPPPAWTLDQKVELVDLVANKSARETEKLLAELEPEVGLPRERQRALGGGRYEVRVILDQGSVDTIAKLKGWLSHVNPGFTTGQLLAYLLQQAERKYDPVRERGRAKRGAPAPAGHVETPYHATGSADAGFPAPGPAAGPSVALAGGSAQNRGAQPEPVPGSEQDRRDTTGSAQNQQPPAGNVGSRTDTEPHRGVRARLPGADTAAWTPAPESTRARRARRHIPAAVRRAVWRRYGGACCYQDPLTGVSCGSTHLVQIDHIVPLAQGGSDDITNFRLRCAVHNRRRDPRCASYRSAPAGARGRSRSISTSSAASLDLGPRLQEGLGALRCQSPRHARCGLSLWRP